MSLGRSLLIVTVLLLVIALILIFVIPTAFDQCVGSSESDSSTDLSGSGGSFMDTINPFSVSATKQMQISAKNHAIRQILTEKKNLSLNSKGLIQRQKELLKQERKCMQDDFLAKRHAFVKFKNASYLKREEQNRIQLAEYERNKTKIFQRPDMLDKMENTQREMNMAHAIQQELLESEKRNQNKHYFIPEGPYGPADLARRILGRKQELDRRSLHNPPPSL